MFGYIMPATPELKVKEYESYRAMYCGLCMQLKADYGQLSRLFLSYDALCVALLADGLSGEAGRPKCQRCIASPRRRCMQSATSGLSTAATAQVLLGWYKIKDSVQDEAFAKKMLAKGAQLLLTPAYKRARRNAPQLDAALAGQMQQQAQLEADCCTQAERAAEPSGKMVAAVLATCAVQPEQRHILERLGLFLGKIIYWLDAAEDFEADQKSGSYNVFLANGCTKAQAVARAQDLCRMAAGEVARCYNLLDLRLNRPILDNIIFLGIPACIDAAGKPRKKEKHA